ncbi:MAG TPA: M20/M25/M40 family metallo-hydrolase [Thermomicrobiales bacterium]|nr:M20/M25/M40 family metallo-hydrolase [Thermomicrobiales bacterium]
MPAQSPELVSSVAGVAESLIADIIALTTELTEVPAPTNDEAERAAVVHRVLVESRYQDVTTDPLANVVGRLPGRMTGGASVLLAAHIDTVFPRDVPIKVTRRGDVLAAPGVGDNTVSVATVAMLATALDRLGIVPATDIHVTGNVGEEGLGDLRGMRAVVDSLPNLGAAIAVEGHSLGRITNRAVGSTRFRVTVTGPGGHSWGDAGRASAIHELARIVSRLSEIPLGTDPKTSLNVGLFEGGISVNTIAPEATAVIDMRSISAEALARLVDQVEKTIRSASSKEISVRIDVVGDRPAGEMPLDRGIVPIGISVLKQLGIDAVCDASSTDANIPISRGIPSMCIGLTTGGNAHRVDEFIRLEPLARGFTQLILTTLAVSDALAAGTLS